MITRLLSQVRGLNIEHCILESNFLISQLMFCTGGTTKTGASYGVTALKDILRFDGEAQKWDKIGTLKKRRMEHTVSVIDIKQVKAYLNCD